MSHCYYTIKEQKMGDFKESHLSLEPVSTYVEPGFRLSFVRQAAFLSGNLTEFWMVLIMFGFKMALQHYG